MAFVRARGCNVQVEVKEASKFIRIAEHGLAG